jgi:hypothetical protein
VFRRIAILGLALLGTQVLVTAGPAAAATVGPNVNVSVRGGSQAEAAIAVDPTNPSRVVIVSNLEHAGGLFLGVSADGGLTWTRSTFASGEGFGRACCDPTVTWDEFGNLFVSWLDNEDVGAIPIAISTDGGLTFRMLRVLHPRAPSRVRTGAAAFVSPPGAESPGTQDENPLEKPGGEPGAEREVRGGLSVDQPTVTAGAGSVWLVWNNNGSMQAAGAPVTGLGQVERFIEREDIPRTRFCSFGDVAIGPDGQVANVCTIDRGRRPVVTGIRFSIDPDGLGPLGFGRSVTIGETNVRQFDPIRPQRDRTVDSETGFAWDRNPASPHFGRLYLIATHEEPDGSSNTEVLLKYSDDDGITWSEPVQVNDVPMRAQFLPKIAIDQSTGNLAIGWHDARNDAGDQGVGDTDGLKNSDAMYYLTFSVDGGATFAPAVQVSPGVSNAVAADNLVGYGDYTGLAFVAGVARPAWADNSNSTGDNPSGVLGAFDVYTSAVTCC